MFEAVKRSGLRRVVYASSMAVYGRSEEYAPAPLSPDAVLKPRSHYGVYKQANEGSARLYWSESGISSIGLRPYVVYGPGRDQGMTSTPTKAMLAAAAGRSYRISYGGRFGFEYADDVAQAFIRDWPQFLRGVLVSSTPPGIRLICQRSSGPLSKRNLRTGPDHLRRRALCHSRPGRPDAVGEGAWAAPPDPSGQRRGRDDCGILQGPGRWADHRRSTLTAPVSFPASAGTRRSCWGGALEPPGLKKETGLGPDVQGLGGESSGGASTRLQCRTTIMLRGMRLSA